MKLKDAVIFLLFALSKAATINKALLHTKAGQICVDEPVKECYPRIFEPTHEWKIIKKDQELPAGKWKQSTNGLKKL